MKSKSSLKGFAAYRTLKLATIDAQPRLAIVTDGQVPYQMPVVLMQVATDSAATSTAG
jgi:hypothetical protein